MTTIHLETQIAAPPSRCFDLARSVDTHAGSMAHSGERAVGGVTSGLMTLGDTVTWEARHFGIRQRLTSRITQFDPPTRFVDEQVSGAFSWFRHKHEFIPADGGTVMIDEFTYGVPLGPLGAVFDRLVLRRYMRRLLTTRNAFLEQAAESGPSGT